MINYSLTPPLLICGFVGVPVARAVIRPRLTVARIQAVVADFYRIRLAEMTSARRARSVARPRQIAMYLARQLTPKSTPDIGRLFGGRDHTTVLHAIKRIERFMLIDGDMAADIDVLSARLGA